MNFFAPDLAVDASAGGFGIFTDEQAEGSV